MKKALATVIIAASLVSLTGCSSWDRRDTGTAVGGVAGGVAGYALSGGNPIVAGVGAVGGAVIGNQLSK